MAVRLLQLYALWSHIMMIIVHKWKKKMWERKQTVKEWWSMSAIKSHTKIEEVYQQIANHQHIRKWRSQFFDLIIQNVISSIGKRKYIIEFCLELFLTIGCASNSPKLYMLSPRSAERERSKAKSWKQDIGQTEWMKYHKI